MPVEVKIERDGRAILSTFLEPLDMQEIVEANDKSTREHLQFATKPVHSIIDTTQIHKLPSNMLSNSMHLSRKLHPMVGTMVVVTNNAFINAMSAILSKAPMGKKIVICQTVEEAWAIIDRLLAEVKSDKSDISVDLSA